MTAQHKHTIGGRIQTLRDVRGVTQRELSKAMNISTSALRNIEYGLTAPRLESLEKISDFFKVSMDYLVRGVNPDGNNLDVFRDTGLNDTSITFLRKQFAFQKKVSGDKSCGYVPTLNALVADGLLPIIWSVNSLNCDLMEVNDKISELTDGIPARYINDEVRFEMKELLERRDLLKLRYFRYVEEILDRFIIGQEEVGEQWRV